MHCTQCGVEAPAGAAFCPNCGTQLKAGRGAGAARMQPGAGRGAAAGTEPERDLWSGAYSPKAMIGAFIGAGLVTVIGLVAALFAGPPGLMIAGIAAVIIFAYLGVLLVYRRMSIRYRLTTQRLLRDTGIIARRSDHMLVINIDDVTVHQTVFDRIFNLGTIRLTVKDESTPNLAMLGIENPRQVADMIDECRRSERNRRGLYTIDA
jgi:membrane protein YdbS with pleckstrin-like domain